MNYTYKRQTLKRKDIEFWKNPRFTPIPQELSSLGKSINTVGQLQDILVNHRDRKYLCFDGELRLRNCKPEDNVDVKIYEALTDLDMLMLRTHVHVRHPWAWFERGDIFLDIMRGMCNRNGIALKENPFDGKQIRDLALKMSADENIPYSPTTILRDVTTRLNIKQAGIKMLQEIRHLIIQGIFKPSFAYDISHVRDVDNRRILLKAVIKEAKRTKGKIFTDPIRWTVKELNKNPELNPEETWLYWRKNFEKTATVSNWRLPRDLIKEVAEYRRTKDLPDITFAAEELLEIGLKRAHAKEET